MSKKLLLILILITLLFTILFGKELHFKIKKPYVYNYPYIIKKYGLKKAKKIIYNKWYQLSYISLNDYKLLKKTYIIGKQYDLGFTLSAILWQESQFGQFLHNFADPSCGYYHKLLPELCKQSGLKANTWNMSRACDKLMNYDFSTQVAINDLLNLKQKYQLRGYKKGKLWKLMVQNYNGSGFNSKVYLDMIRLNIFYLKQIKKSLDD